MKADHTQVTRLLKTARGQIDGILKMVDEDRYCMDVSNQLLATQSILKKANRMVLVAHMDSCVRQAVESGKPEEKLAELADISVQFLADIEKGRKSMTILTLKKIAAALLVPFSIRLCHLASPVVTMTF